MKVAISQNIKVLNSETDSQVDCLQNDLLRYFQKLPLSVFPVPNNGNTQDWLEELKPDGIILTGGCNIGEYLERDLTETHLLNYAMYKRKIPVLGICRGMQFIAYLAGSEIIPIENHVRDAHEVYGHINQSVNSYHNFTIKDCPTGYHILARCVEDDAIEAIRHDTLPILAIMWHPEREKSQSLSDLSLISEHFRCEQ